jgi:hypothetical protein
VLNDTVHAEVATAIEDWPLQLAARAAPAG